MEGFCQLQIQGASYDSWWRQVWASPVSHLGQNFWFSEDICGCQQSLPANGIGRLPCVMWKNTVMWSGKNWWIPIYVTLLCLPHRIWGFFFSGIYSVWVACLNYSKGSTDLDRFGGSRGCSWIADSHYFSSTPYLFLEKCHARPG